MRLSHTRLARADILDIWITIADDNPGAADRIYGRLQKRLEDLIEWPLIGVAQPEIAPDARMLVERPYVILYRVLPDGVQIVRVLHGARDINGILFAEGLE